MDNYLSLLKLYAIPTYNTQEKTETDGNVQQNSARIENEWKHQENITGN